MRSESLISFAELPPSITDPKDSPSAHPYMKNHLHDDNNDIDEDSTVIADEMAFDTEESFENETHDGCISWNLSDSPRKDLFSASEKENTASNSKQVVQDSRLVPSTTFISRKRVAVPHSNNKRNLHTPSSPLSNSKSNLPNLRLFRATSIESLQSPSSRSNPNDSHEHSPSADQLENRTLFGCGVTAFAQGSTFARSSFTGSPIAEIPDNHSSMDMEDDEFLLVEENVSNKIRKLNLSGGCWKVKETDVQKEKRDDSMRFHEDSKPNFVGTQSFSSSFSDYKDDISPKEVSGFPPLILTNNSSMDLYPIDHDFDSPPAVMQKKKFGHYAPPTTKKVSAACPSSPERPHRTRYEKFIPDTPSIGRKSRHFMNLQSDSDRGQSNISRSRTEQDSYPSSRFDQDFEILGELGNGSFGYVYKCRSRLDGCTYAVKAAKRRVKGTLDREQMLKEVTALAALSDLSDTAAFHVVRYHQAWMEDDRLHIQTELCTSTLRMEIDTGLLHKDTKRQFKMLREILLALRLIHQNNMVHLDVKPDNIFVKDGSFKLGDFGLVSKATAIDVDEGDDRYMCKDLFDGNHRDLTKVSYFMHMLYYVWVSE